MTIGVEHFYKNIIIAREHFYNLKTDIIQVWVEGIYTAPPCARSKGYIIFVGDFTSLVNAKTIIHVYLNGLAAIHLKTARANIRKVPNQIASRFIHDAHIVGKISSPYTSSFCYHGSLLTKLLGVC
jgi:hypothetical protein